MNTYHFKSGPLPFKPWEARNDYEKSICVPGERGMYEVVIGLEVHAQVTSNTKLFSSSPTQFGAEPNTQVSFLDGAFPGMLPVLNRHCVAQAIRTGLGLQASIARNSRFERKHYFYPDLPQGYQISQYEKPIVYQGHLSILLENGELKPIGITRLHLEQDAGKSIHHPAQGKSYIDLNRSGAPLMEIVSEPQLSSPEEAVAYLKKLRNLLRYLGTCDGNMEEGSLRADANISLRLLGQDLGTRSEIKNLNSFRFLQQALTYEIQRQKEILDQGGTFPQQTRLFDTQTGETVFLREKEDPDDYRYFPDPDLPDVAVSEDWIQEVASGMPELPDQRAQRFIDTYGLSPEEAHLIALDHAIAEFFQKAIDLSDKGQPQAWGKLVANWILGEVFSYLKKQGVPFTQIPLTPQRLFQLLTLIKDQVISSSKGKEVLALMWESSLSPQEIVDEHGWGQISDPEALKEVIQKVLDQHTTQVQAYLNGKVQLFGFFVGKAMALTQGKANPQALNSLLKEMLPPPQES